MIRLTKKAFSLIKQVLAVSFSLLLFITQAFAVQPMTESDLEVVSATTGSNILNVFGNSKAGLKIDLEGDAPISDTPLNSEQFQEGEATKPIALNQIRTLEDDSNPTPNNTNSEVVVSNSSQSAILKLNEQTTGNASLFSTNSEIKYKNNNFNHEMRLINNDAVAVSRDLQIDQLKLENLRGDGTDDGRSAGSIYLSDWHSQGDTRIFSNRE